MPSCTAHVRFRVQSGPGPCTANVRSYLRNMTRGVGTIAGTLLLALAGLSFGIDQGRYATSTPQNTVKKKPNAQPPLFDHRRGTSNWPYGPGYNFPYPDRPYGDPGHGGE